MSRFRIEDLISQDAGSVVYLGVDEKTGERAALRRFFLSEGESTGIAMDDQTGFSKAIALLTQVHHPCLRRVLEGGIDEVDHVPYVATEWVDGVFLRDVLAEHGLSPESGALLVRQGLDVMAHLESFFGEGAHWIKLDPSSIIMRETEEGESFAFSVCLDRWMGIKKGEQGLGELADLVEQACGISSAAKLDGGALGEWCRHVRETEVGVAEARVVFDFVSGKETEASSRGPALLTGAAVSQAPQAYSQPVVLPPKEGHGLAIALSIAAAVVMLAVGGYFIHKSRSDEPVIASSEEVEEHTGGGKEAAVEKPEPVPAVPASVPDAVSTEGPDLPVVVKADPEEEPPVEPEVVEPEVAVVEPVEAPPAPGSFEEKVLRMRAELNAAQEEVEVAKERTEFLANEGALLSTRAGDELTVIGTVHHVRETKATLVFEFTRERGPDVLCVRMSKAGEPTATLDVINEFKGKQVRFQGTVEHYSTGDYNRVCLRIKSLGDLEG